MNAVLEEFQRRQTQAQQRVASTLAEANAKVSPEEAARRARTARQLGITPEVAGEVPIQTHIQEVTEAIGRAPRVGEWITRSSERAALARGDMGNLADIDEHVAQAPRRKRSFIDRAASYLDLGGPLGQLSAGALRGTQAVVRGAADLTPSNVGAALDVGMADLTAGVQGALETTLALEDKYSPGEWAERQLFGGTVTAWASDKYRASRQAYERYAQENAPEAQTEEGEGILTGIRSLPSSGAALLGGAYFQSAKVAATLMGVVVGGQSAGRARDYGLSLEQSALYGTIDAAIEAGTELVPFARLLPGGGRSFARRAIESTAADLLGEQGATFLQDLNAWAQIESNEGKTFEDFIAERPEAAYQTLFASLTGSALMNTAMGAAEFAARKSGRRIATTQAPEETERFMRALGDIASASAVLQRDQGSFEDFVRSAAEANPDAPSDVFIEAEQLQNVLNQSDLTVEQVYEMTGMMPEQLEQAAARGEDVVIPVEQYAARIAAQPLGEQLMPHLRLDPDDMSRTQAEVFLQEAQAEFQRDAEAEMVKREAGDERAASRARVEERVLGELASARRFNEETNRVYASIFGAFFDTQSAKIGMTAEELADQYGLKVQSGEVAQASYDQLGGLPANSRGAFDPAEQAAQQYAASRGFQYTPPQTYARVDPVRATRIAQAYEEMADAPTDPVVIAAYEALVEETLAQYEIIKATGLQIEFVEGEDPYGGNPWGAVDDVRDNNHIWVFSTEDGYGQEGISPEQRAVNPMLQPVKGEKWSGKQVLVNDVFRVVHDYFGHIKSGVGFRADGEENAWRSHAAMYSPLARRAMTTETRGQNSWLNYGPHGAANRTAKIGDTVFAEQKIGLMPDWTSEEGAFDETFDQSAAPLQTLPMGVQGTGPGGRVRNWDLGEALTLRQRAEYGRPLDPTDPSDYQIALGALLEDYRDQQDQPDNGEAWYSDDIAEALAITTRILPELEDPVRRDLFLTAVALLSPQRGPVDNWGNAIVAMTGYSIEGRFADRHPDGTQFGVKSHSTGLGLFEHLIREHGEIGALVWLNDEHTGAEMEAVRRASGMFKNKADLYLPKETNKTESKLGVYIFGPKVGDFMLNSMGLDHNAVTIDLWMARTYNRVVGRLTDVNEKQAAEGLLADAIRGKAERAIVKQLVRDAAAEAGIAPSAMQAALWYFEQRLYRNHGIKSDSTSFSDAAREAAFRRGIPVDGIVAQGSAPRSAEAEGRDLEEGVRVYAQSGLNPLDAFKRQSFYPTRATRHEDGTVYADIPDFYPDRQQQLAEQLGAKAVVAVPANDKRLNEGVELWFSRPPLNPDGTVTLHHWGAEGITETDPARWGESGAAPRSERQTMTSSLPRTFFGIASGQPGGYIVEFPGRTQYEARVPIERLYDVAQDPDGLRIGGAPAASDIFWHGSPSGDLRGGPSGLHLGTREAARQALEARIGIPADGSQWDGAKTYGKTKLAGRKTQARLKKRGRNVGTGYNSRAPEEDYYPADHPAGMPNLSRDLRVTPDMKPVLQQFRLKGPMTNSRFQPHGDWKANGYMKASLKKGNAKRGFYYRNEGEDSGSISIVVPGPEHVEKTQERISVPELERRVKAAGYLGYWTADPQLGLVATVFEPLAVQPAQAQVYAQDAVFFSALERAIERTATTKASAQQWDATLRKTPGIKEEELEWTGLLDFLAGVEGPITREQLLEVVRGAGLRVDEVVLGQELEIVLRETLEDGQYAEDYDVVDASGRVFGTFSSEEFAREYINEVGEGRGGNSTQFATWSSDPNNETYRELLITLPAHVTGRMPSTHWDQPGVIAHARFMDKTDADGKKVLFIEEVQSDWHQKGRDQGYAQATDEGRLAELRQASINASVRVDEARRAIFEAAGQVGLDAQAYHLRQGRRWEAEEIGRRIVAGDIGEVHELRQAIGAERFLDLRAELTEAELRERETGIAVNNATGIGPDSGIPNAPFKTSWPALVMKRMIRWAAEHGYDRIAWTTGEQQAERYSLSEAVGSLDVAVDDSPVGRSIEEQGGERSYKVVFGSPRAANIVAENISGISIDSNDQLRMTRAALIEAFGSDLGKRIADEADAGFLTRNTRKGATVAAFDEAEAARQRQQEAQDQLRTDAVKAMSDKAVRALGMDREAANQHALENAKSMNKYELADEVPDGRERLISIRRLQEKRADLAGKATLARMASYFDTTLQGEDLRVGGEGMKAFYDRNLVNITNSLIKKYGARVGPIRMLPEGDLEQVPFQGVISETQPGFDLTPELADAAMGGFPLFQRDRAPRGQIAFGVDITQAPSVITLLRGADLSTFVHELGHFFFEVTNHMASRAGAPAQLVADRDAMLRYLGVASVTEWEQRTPAQRRDGHERMARSFEGYLFEGRAPSLELRGVFAKLRNWMLTVYRTITRLNVELTDEVRGVFDRMLAAEEAIAEAEADAELRPFFTDKPEGMSDVDWEEYQRLNSDATADAAKQLESRSLRDMRYAGRAVAREIKRLQGEVKEQRDAMREEVEAELAEMPIYRAVRLFRTGQIDGEAVEGEHKLNTEEVRAALQLEPGMPIGDAFRGMTKKGGLHPQQAAELFGFTSADHLLKDLMFVAPFKDAVEAETDQRMRERYGDLNSPEEVEEAARAAVHNEVRSRFVATELAALQNAPGKKRVLAAAARRMAEDMIARLRIRDLRPGQYEAAERRAARAAQEAGTTDLDEAIRQKRNQLLQFNLAKAAHAAREETKKARDYLQRFTLKKVRANLDPDFMDQIDQLMERFELRQVSNREADRRKSLADWVEKMRADGFEPALDPETLREIGRKPWRELTVEEMRGLLDAIRNIEHLGRLTKQLLLARDKATIDQAAGEMGEAVRVNATRTVELPVGAKTWWEGVKSGVADFFAMHRKIANLAYIFDGNAYGGVFWERYIRPMNERADWQAERNRTANERLAEVFRPLLGANLSRREFEPAIGRSISLEDRVMVALNMGNELNVERVLEGDQWTPEQLQAVVAPLTAAHWDFVESVWRELDTYWPEIAAKERRVSGIEPERVEPRPFQIEIDGELRYFAGGYFPIKYDADKSSKAEADESAEVLRQMTRGLYTNAQTRRGHTKARVNVVRGRPLRKDFGVIFGHVNQVIHDLAWHEYLIDANRLLRHGAVDSAIREHHGPEVLRWMRKALEDIAIGDIPAQNAFEKSIHHLRTGVSIAAMGWSVWTSLLQPTGLTQSMARIGARHVLKGVGDLFANPAKMNAKYQWVKDNSKFMRDRGDTMQREINEIRNRIGDKSPKQKLLGIVIPEGVSSAMADSFFYMIQKAQLMADLPTWLGQYSKSMDAGEQHDRAVAIADQAVIDSQGSGHGKDLAGVQRGSQLMRLFTNFYSYFSATFNLMADRTTQMRRVGAKDLPYYFVDMMMLSVVPATIASVMYSALKGDDDDDDWGDWLNQIAQDNLVYLLGLMVGVREIGSALAGIGGYQGPAGARFFAETGRFGKQVAQGEPDEALVRAGNSMAGILLHYPSTQLDRTVRGTIAFSQGDAGPEAVAVGPPVGQ